MSCGWFWSRWSDTDQVHNYRLQSQEASFSKLPIQPTEKDTSGPSEQLQLFSLVLCIAVEESLRLCTDYGGSPGKSAFSCVNHMMWPSHLSVKKVYFCPSCSHACSCCSQEECILSAQGKKDVVYTGKWSAACEIKAKHPHPTYFKQELRMVVSPSVCFYWVSCVQFRENRQQELFEIKL